MQEKRKFIRIQAPLVVVYNVAAKPKGSKKTVTKDFSEGGIRLLAYEKLEVGTVLELHIEIPFDTIPIFAKGRVIWQKALSTDQSIEIYDVGIQFIQMQSFDKKRMLETSKRFLAMLKNDKLPKK